MSPEKYTVRVLSSIREIERDAWEGCANPSHEVPYDPFISYEFLDAIERSDSASPQTGWATRHLAVESSTGEIVGVLPLYIKGHSQGEYVFDHAWAEAFYRAGGEYYPKLLSAVPFTPVTGRRILIKPSPQATLVETHLIAAGIEVTRQLEMSSLHINFLEEPQWQRLATQGFLGRTDQQFHWRNEGYRDFDDFLKRLSSKKRKNLKRERRLAIMNDITTHWLTGSDLQEEHWDAFYAFYMDTGSRKWGRSYLNRQFFSLINQSMANNILLILCKREGRYIAGALNFIGSEVLYGRNWGCIEDHPFLHFETCYYQAIDFAIAHGLQRIEAGAQGPHKLARGYLPTRTYSAHWIANKSLRKAVSHYLSQERHYVDEEMTALLTTHSPFRDG